VKTRGFDTYLKAFAASSEALGTWPVEPCSLGMVRDAPLTGAVYSAMVVMLIISLQVSGGWLFWEGGWWCQRTLIADCTLKILQWKGEVV